MTVSRRVIVSGLAGVVLSLSVPPEPSGAQTAVGFITDPAGKPINGAEVRIIAPGGSAIATEIVGLPKLHYPREVIGSQFAISASASAPEMKYSSYTVGACAEGYAPQAVGAPFARGDTLRVNFKLAPASSRGHVHFGPGACDWQVDSVDRVSIQTTRSFAARASLTAAQIDRLVEGVPHDTAAARHYVEKQLSALSDTLAAARTADAQAHVAYMTLSLLRIAPESAFMSLRARVRAALPPGSRWWTTTAYGVQGATGTLLGIPERTDTTVRAKALRRAARTYLEQMEANVGDPGIQNAARYELIRLANAEGDTARSQTIFSQMLRDQPEYPYTKIAASHMAAGRAIRVGSKMPPFDFAALPGTPGSTVTNANIQSRYTLISFWGTWCGPCIASQPTLTALYAKYHSSGLNIISIAADESPEIVTRFRKARWLTPWANAYAGTTEDPALRRLGVLVYPTEIVVDSSGTIVMLGESLSPEELRTRVERFFVK